MTTQGGSVAALRQELRDLDAQRLAIEEEIALLSERLNAPGQPGIKGSLLDKQGFPRADIDVVQVRRDRQRIIYLTNDQKALTDKLAKLLAELHEAVRKDGQGSGAAAAATTSAGYAASAPAQASGVGAAGGGAPAGSSQPAASTAEAASAMDVDSGAGTSSAAPAGNGAAATIGPALVPFALVDEVSGGSPAEAAGLQVGDLLCAFGDVSAAPAGEGGDNGGGSGGGGGLLQRVAAVLAASEGRPVAARVLRQGAPLELSLTPARWPGRGLLGCHLRPL